MSEKIRSARELIAGEVSSYGKTGRLDSEELANLGDLLFAEQCGNLSPDEAQRLKFLQEKSGYTPENKAA